MNKELLKILPEIEDIYIKLEGYSQYFEITKKQLLYNAKYEKINFERIGNIISIIRK